MIKGAQIRLARILLRWSEKQLAIKAKLRVEAIERAERSTGELPLTTAHAAAIQRALETAGVEFIPDERSVRLTERRSQSYRP